MKRITKKTLSVLLAVLMLVCTLPFAASAKVVGGECGGWHWYNGEDKPRLSNITWSLDTEIGTLKIDGKGYMADYNYDHYDNDIYAPWEQYKEYIKSVEISEGVEYIGNFAFYNCKNLMSLNIPSTVTRIAGEAFEGCSALERVNINDLSAWCRIDYDTINDMDTYTPFTYADDLYINGVLATDIVIPDDVESISNFAFYGCRSLKNVIIPDSVNSIGFGAFSYCTNLESITIGKSVTYVDNCAFEGCKNLRKVNIIDLSKWVNIYFNYFEYGPYANPLETGASLYINGKLATDIVIPDGTERISESAFYNCKNLTSVVIPNTVKRIEDGSFSGCSNLTDIVIPDSVEIVYSGSFANCTNLESVTIGKNVSEIGYGAFAGCDNIKDIYYNGNPKQMGLITIGSGNPCFTTATIHYNHPHTYFSTVLTPATCTADGETKFVCIDCGENHIETIAATGHNYYIKDFVLPLCNKDGSMMHVCVACGDSYEVVLPSTNSHADADNDGKCDSCGKQLSGTTPTEPTEPDKPDTENCDCMCHKTGFAGFIWKLVKIFYQIFRTNKTCACGTAHY
ncbi:MAG: leucine-rich repeat domain-containing protein [Ruminococcus sp.]|nr:leucine-rich repeat domain-containing protein [Ruminococcus sp.]